MKIHMPSDDEIEIIKLKSKFVYGLARVIAYEEEQSEIMKSLADKMVKAAKSKRDLVEIIEKLVEAEEIAVKNPVADIDHEEIDVFKNSASNLSSSLQNQMELADSFQQLASVMKDFLKKKKEYLKLIEELTEKQSTEQNLEYKLMKMKNKYVDDKKTRKVEEKITDLVSDITRLQSQSDRKLSSLMDESEQLNSAWKNLKNDIKKFGW